MKSPLFSIAILSLLLFFGVAQADQSISIEHAKSDAYYEGQNRNYAYTPKTTSFYYFVDLREALSVGASLWRSEATEHYDEQQLQMEEEGAGASFNINYLQGNWRTGLSLSASKTSLDANSLAYPVFFEEEVKSRDINFSIGYLVEFDRIDVIPTLGIGAQKIKWVSSGAIPSSNYHRDEQQTKSYVFADVVVGMWYEISQSLMFQPTLQFGWTDSFSDEASFTTRVSKGKRNVRSTRSDSTGNIEGSGYIGLSLSLLMDVIQLQISHSKTLALDINSATTAAELTFFF